MATYIALVDFTIDGINNIQYTTRRSEDFAEEAKKLGVDVKDVYWTMGAHDGVLIFDAPDDETASAAMLSLGARGKARSHTLRAFNREEMDAILGHM